MIMILMLEDAADVARYNGTYKHYKFPKELVTVLSVIAQDKRVAELPMNKIYAILCSCKWLKSIPWKSGKKTYRKFYFPTLKAIAENGDFQPYTHDIKKKLSDTLYKTFDYKEEKEEKEEEPWDETNMEYVNQQLLNKYQFESIMLTKGQVNRFKTML